MDCHGGRDKSRLGRMMVRSARREVVMLHGWGMSTRVLADLALAIDGLYRVHLLELPGHGSRAQNAVNVAGDWLPELLDRAPARALWCGWSMGAGLALAAARLAPERVIGLVSLSLPVRFVASADWPWGVAPAWFDEFRAACRADSTASWQRFTALVARDEANPRAALRWLRGRLAETPAPAAPALLAGLEWLGPTDWRDFLRVCTTPLLAIWGAADRLTPPPPAAAWLELCPRGRRSCLAGAGHLPFWPQPDAVAGELVTFFDQLH